MELDMSRIYEAMRTCTVIVLATTVPFVVLGEESKRSQYWNTFPRAKQDKQLASCRFELGRNDFTDGNEPGVGGDRRFILWERKVPPPNRYWNEPSFFVVTEYWDDSTAPVRDNVVWKLFAYRPYGPFQVFEHWYWDIVYHREHKHAYLVRLACERHQERAKVTVWEVHRELRCKIDDIKFDPKKPLDKQDLPTPKPLSEHEFKIPKMLYEEDKVKPTFLSVRAITRRDGLRIFLQRTDTSDPVHLEYDFVSDKWRHIEDK